MSLNPAAFLKNGGVVSASMFCFYLASRMETLEEQTLFVGAGLALVMMYYGKKYLRGGNWNLPSPGDPSYAGKP